MENIDKPLDEVIAMDADAKPAPVRRGGRPPKQSGQGGKVRSDPTTRERAPRRLAIVSARRRTSSTPTRELSSPDDRRSPVIPTRRLAVTRAMATTPAPPTA